MNKFEITKCYAVFLFVSVTETMDSYKYKEIIYKEEWDLTIKSQNQVLLL